MKVVVSHVFGFENRGDASLVRTLCDEIKTAIPENLDLYGISRDPISQTQFLPDVKWGEAFGTSNKANPLIKRLENLWLMLLALFVARIGAPAWGVKLLPPPQATAMRHLKSSDLVISCAGGFLHDAYVSIFAILTQFTVAHIFKVPVILAPQSIGPISGRFARFWTRRILLRCRHIFVREDVSLDVLKEMEIPDHLYSYFPDLALLDTTIDFDSVSNTRQEIGLGPDEPFFCVTCVDWAFTGNSDPAAVRKQYESQLAHAINQIQTETRLTAVILNQVGTDMPVNERVKAMVQGRVLIDRFERMPDLLRGFLSEAELIIASRFHSCLFALMARRPVLAISYLHKTDGIMSRLNLSARVQSINSLDGDKLAQDALLDLSDPARRDAIVKAMQTVEEASFARVLRAKAQID